MKVDFARVDILFFVHSFVCCWRSAYASNFDTGDVQAAISTDTASGSETTYLDVTFNHDDASTASGSYELSYTYKGCIHSLDPSSSGLNLPVLQNPTFVTSDGGTATCIDEYEYVEFRMEETSWSGATNEVKGGSGVDGTAVGGAATSTTSPAKSGNPGTCGYGTFNGSNQFVSIPYRARLNSDDFTIAMWVRVDGNENSYRSVINSRVGRQGYTLYADDNNRWSFWTGDGSSFNSITASASILSGTWTHIAISFETSSVSSNDVRSGTKRLYINGVQSEFTASGSYLPNTGSTPVTIGSGGGNGESFHFNGAIDEVTFATSALSASEVTALYQRTHSCFCAKSSLVRYNMQQLSEIPYTDIKTVDGTSSSVAFCARLGLLDSGGAEQGYKEADIKVSWTTGQVFEGGTTTDENGPDESEIDIGDVEVSAQLCSSIAPANIPTTYQQGEGISICVHSSVPKGSVVLTSVDELRFWIDNNLEGTNGQYDDGEITQLGVTNGALQGTTSIIPAVGSVCAQPFSAYIQNSEDVGCVLTIVLRSDFFESTTGGSNGNMVRFAGSVTIEFANGNRRRFLAKNRELSQATTKVAIEIPKVYRAAPSNQGLNNREQVADSFGSQFRVGVTDDGDIGCGCRGFIIWRIICWVFCLFGIRF